MLRELHDMSPEEKGAHATKNGGFNDFPPNWQEIDESKFAKSSYFIFSPVLREFRQMFRPEERTVPAVGAQLYWFFDGTGYAVVNDHWAGTVKFYSFGELRPGAYAGIDSSD